MNPDHAPDAGQAIDYVRRSEWGHWRLTFSETVDGVFHIRGHVSFPVGPRGPVDMPRRMEYRTMCAAWVERGELPLEVEPPQ